MIASNLTFGGRPTQIGLLVLFLLLIGCYIPLANGRYGAMNNKCNVYFNYTHEQEDTKHIFLNQLKRYENCWDDMVTKNMTRNLTNNEESDCHSKCAQIAEGSVDENGAFNINFMYSVEEEYLKYSNATDSFIDKISGMLLRCAKEVAKTFELLQKSNETIPGECQINGLYHRCWSNVFWNVDSSTKEELCGDKK